MGNYFQILQSIYGLKQAARVWYFLLEEFLRSIGFTPRPSDPSVLTNGKVIIGRKFLAIYIDDWLIADKDEADILHVKKSLKARFEVKDVSEVQIVFDIRVGRYSQKMTLDQLKYVRVIFKQFLDSASSQYFILMEPDVVNRLPDKEEEVLNEERRSQYLQAI